MRKVMLTRNAIYEGIGCQRAATDLTIEDSLFKCLIVGIPVNWVRTSAMNDRLTTYLIGPIDITTSQVFISMINIHTHRIERKCAAPEE